MRRLLQKRSVLSPVVAVAALLLTALTLVGPAPSANAEIKLPTIIGDNMVLQRNTRAPIWGWADPGEKITVVIPERKQSHSTTADKKGQWSVKLDPLRVGEPLTLHVQGADDKDKLVLKNILVGEVWVCSGQSNMQWSLSRARDADLESLAANFPQIRLVQLRTQGSQEPQTHFEGGWTECTPESVPGFSAVGYLFGRQLHRTLGVPVGLIDNAWGGSACEAWIRRDLLTGKPLYKPLLERWAKVEKEYDFEAEKAKFQERLAVYREKAAALRKAGKPAPRRPRPPRDRLRGQHRPANLYHGRLKPVMPFAIRGVIWYQGETNASRAYQYRDMFPLMIQNWRDDWGQGDFPFYFVQLADFRPEQQQPSESAWAELREAQTLTLSRLKNTGQAVIIDIGEGKDIHPTNKQDVAKRLARWALAVDYGLQIPHRSPTYRAVDFGDGKATVTFAHVAKGLRAFDTREVVGFAMAGKDRKFHWAKGRIVGKDRVELTCPQVEQPVAVRYAWADNPVCNLFNSAGLPATPFRTDDWKGVTADAR